MANVIWIFKIWNVAFRCSSKINKKFREIDSWVAGLFKFSDLFFLPNILCKNRIFTGYKDSCLISNHLYDARDHGETVQRYGNTRMYTTYVATGLVMGRTCWCSVFRCSFQVQSCVFLVVNRCAEGFEFCSVLL